MPPKRKLTRSTTSRKTRQSTRRQNDVENAIPTVYRDMLAEAASEQITTNAQSGHGIKRQRVLEDQNPIALLDHELFDDSFDDSSTNGPISKFLTEKSQQILLDDFENSDNSDAEFEDVDLEANADIESEDDRPEQKPLELDLSKASIQTPKRSTPKRKPVGLTERKLRLDIHKMHVLCLLGHLQIRNRWCEDERVHSILKPLVSRKTIALLHVDESEPQYQRSYAFIKGLEEVSDLWKTEWTITERGMRRAHWRDEVDSIKESDEGEDLIDYSDFTNAAQTRQGSRDLGAQLFCALLRSLAIDTRLVCSLQVLPFSAVAKTQSPEKPKSKYIQAPSQDYGGNTGNGISVKHIKKVNLARKRIVDSQYPIFWVEAFSSATTSWIPIDPLVRHTINKPKTGFEPPASDSLNSMSYVIAFEEDGSVQDVTRRYAHWYNAKTRRVRVESTKGGEAWWNQTVKHFEKPFEDIRDEIESSEFVRRAASEGLPRNVQDFKGHPIYVLERHLRVNEVINPRVEVGVVNTGTNKSSKSERVFRRQNVHFCRTADAWYRRGRDVKQGEVPLKRVAAKRNRDAADPIDNEEEDLDSEGKALYAEYQTEIYKPPGVVDGQIPKNAFGNLDIYVPSMIPAGAIHVKHPLAAQAARTLGIDYAEAVTGFEFKGRQGTAVIEGAVVSNKVRVAIVAIIIGLESQAQDEAETEKSRIVLGLWKRWLTALRVMQRVEDEYGNNEDQDDFVDISNTKLEDEDLEGGGGFMPDVDSHMDEQQTEDVNKDLKISMLPNLDIFKQISIPIHHEIIVIESPHEVPHPSTHQANEVSSTQTSSREPKDEEEGGFIREDEIDAPPIIHHDNHDSSSEAGGGFIPDEDMAIDSSPGPAIDKPDEQDVISSIPDPLYLSSDKQYLTYDGNASDADEKPTNENEIQDQDHDNESLLSHDPAEDDAEPEWLLDVLGEDS